MDDKEFTKLTTKLLKRLILEKENLNLVKFTEKYNLPFKIRKKVRRKYIKWTIIDLILILKILKISLYDFVVMLEKSIEDEGLKND